MQFITEEEDKEIELFVLFSELIKGNYISIKTLTEKIKLDEDLIYGLLTKSEIPEDSFFIAIEDYFGIKLFPIINNPNFNNKRKFSKKIVKRFTQVTVGTGIFGDFRSNIASVVNNPQLNVTRKLGNKSEPTTLIETNMGKINV